MSGIADRKNQWPAHDIEFATSELAKEYPTISLTLIGIVVNLAQVVVLPGEGRVKLLQIARKNISR